MKLSPTWRRHPLAGYVVLILALAALGLGYAVVSPAGDRARAAAQPSEETIAKGEELFNASCASCHGLNAAGTDKAPSLIGVGAASVHFQVSTGRMPAESPYKAQSQEKNVDFTDGEIRALAAYVASLSPGGAPIPSDEQVAYQDADVALGGELFRANCASCHNFAGEGGALTYGKEAPQLTDASPRQIYEAMLTGPGAMPSFTEGTITPDEKRAIIHYVRYTAEEPNPGGFGLGRFGPVPEGLAGWLVGTGVLVALGMWIAARKHD